MTGGVDSPLEKHPIQALVVLIPRRTFWSVRQRATRSAFQVRSQCQDQGQRQGPWSKWVWLGRVESMPGNCQARCQLVSQSVSSSQSLIQMFNEPLS